MTKMPSWLTDAAEAVTAATDTAKVQAQVETLSEARTNLASHLATLKVLTSAVEAGGGGWFSGYTGTPDLFDALKAATKSPTQAALGTLNRTLNTFAPSARDQALSDWKAYGAGRMGNVLDLAQLADTLAGVASVAPLADDLQHVLQQLAPASNRLPTKDAFDLLDEAEKRLAALEKALQPMAVRTFLSAVARGGASLEMLTHDVRSWLKENRAEFSFRVTAGSPAEE